MISFDLILKAQFYIIFVRRKKWKEVDNRNDRNEKLSKILFGKWNKTNNSFYIDHTVHKFTSTKIIAMNKTIQLYYQTQLAAILNLMGHHNCNLHIGIITTTVHNLLLSFVKWQKIQVIFL